MGERWEPLERLSLQSLPCVIVYPLLKTVSILNVKWQMYSALTNKHLFDCDRAPDTKERYWHIVTSYQKWLNDRSPDAVTAQEFLTYWNAPR